MRFCFGRALSCGQECRRDRMARHARPVARLSSAPAGNQARVCACQTWCDHACWVRGSIGGPNAPGVAAHRDLTFSPGFVAQAWGASSPFFYRSFQLRSALSFRCRSALP